MYFLCIEDSGWSVYAQLVEFLYLQNVIFVINTDHVFPLYGGQWLVCIYSLNYGFLI